jgi:hypothetical protein
VVPDEHGRDPTTTRPGVPTGRVALLAIVGVVLAGALGALAGWGIVDTDCGGDCGGAATLGAIVGAVVGVAGGAVVAVLVLRARFHWRIPQD